MSQNSALEAAIAQAQAAAGALPTTVNAGVQTDVVNYTPAPRSGTPLTLDDMPSARLEVKAWMKLSKFGISLGKDNTMFQELPVRIDMADIQPCFTVRYGNPAKYSKTFDHVVDTQGRPWVQVLQMAQQIDPKASEYPSADVPLIAREDIKNSKGEVLVEAGEVIGHTIPTTGWKFFQSFIRSLNKAGKDIHTGVYDVDLKWLYQKNDKGEWGVVTFENVRDAE